MTKTELINMGRMNILFCATSGAARSWNIETTSTGTAGDRPETEVLAERLPRREWVTEVRMGAICAGTGAASPKASEAFLRREILIDKGSAPGA